VNATTNSERPLLAVTMGDPAGIGPEVVLRTLAQGELTAEARLLVVGTREVFEERARRFSLPVELPSVAGPRECGDADFAAALYEMPGLDLVGLRLGVASAGAGRASLAYVEQALEWALSEEVDALVTGPINKEALLLAGSAFPGHTELLATQTGSRRATMMLVGGGLRVTLVTTHVALRLLPGLLTTKRILQTIQVTDEALRTWFGIGAPRIAVCALNPHAGDAGRFGTEDITVVTPAVEQAAGKGINCVGPLPSDALFYHAHQGRYDAVVALYHDQGLIPVKLLAFDRAVNVTLGLPIIRTSVDHGTAYDIVEKGVASASSMIEAAKLASRFARRERPAGGAYAE